MERKKKGKVIATLTNLTESFMLSNNHIPHLIHFSLSLRKLFHLSSILPLLPHIQFQLMPMLPTALKIKVTGSLITSVHSPAPLLTSFNISDPTQKKKKKKCVFSYCSYCQYFPCQPPQQPNSRKSPLFVHPTNV